MKDLTKDVFLVWDPGALLGLAAGTGLLTGGAEGAGRLFLGLPLARPETGKEAGLKEGAGGLTGARGHLLALSPSPEVLIFWLAEQRGGRPTFLGGAVSGSWSGSSSRSTVFASWSGSSSRRAVPGSWSGSSSRRAVSGSWGESSSEREVSGSWAGSCFWRAKSGG